jgi:thioredoxin-related protein
MKNLFLLILIFGINPVFSQEIHWLTFPQMLEAYKKHPKRVIVDIYTDWCGWCKKLDKDVYENAVIAKYVNENFYAVKINAEKEGQIVFRGDTFNLVPHNGRKLTHQLALNLMNNRSAYPTTALLDEKLNLYSSVPGYMEPKEFDAVLKYFVGGNHNHQTWEEFKLGFKSEIN